MAEIQQLVKRDPSSGSYETIFPTTYLDAVYDRESGTPLTEILNGFNMYFLSYVGSTQNTRLQVPPSVRRLGLWISYVQYDGSIVTEWYKGTLVDDISFASNDNWNIGSNSLVGDISISAGGNWVINGVDSGAPARGEAGISPIVIIENNKFRVSFDRGDSYIDLSQTPVFTQFRVHDNKLEQSVDLGATWIVVSDELAYQFRNSGNKLQVSKDLGATWEDTSDYIAAWFKFTSVADGGGIDNIGKIQISRDNGSTWVDLSGVFTTNFTIKGYVATVGALPTGAAQGDVYGVGPTYDPTDTGQINPIYELYVKDSTGWVNNGRFTSITAGVVQVTGQSTTEVMSQKAVTDELTAINSDVADLELKKVNIYGTNVYQEHDMYITKDSQILQQVTVDWKIGKKYTLSVICTDNCVSKTSFLKTDFTLLFDTMLVNGEFFDYVPNEDITTIVVIVEAQSALANGSIHYSFINYPEYLRYSDVVDNLLSNDPTSALSSKQGKVINTSIISLNNSLGIESVETQTAIAEFHFSATLDGKKGFIKITTQTENKKILVANILNSAFELLYTLPKEYTYVDLSSYSGTSLYIEADVNAVITLYFISESLLSTNVQSINTRHNKTLEIEKKGYAAMTPVTVKKDGSGDFMTIQEAINSITDASIDNQYDIQVYDDFIITDLTELWLLIYPNTHTAATPTLQSALFITKDYVNVRGIGSRKKLSVTSQNDLPSGSFGNIQIIIPQGNSIIKNFRLVLSGGRYAIHQESSGTPTHIDVNSTTIFEDLIVEHLGNAAYPNGSGWTSTIAQANGTASGSRCIFRNCKWISREQGTPFYSHLNSDFTEESVLEFHNCSVVPYVPLTIAAAINEIFVIDAGSNIGAKIKMFGNNFIGFNAFSFATIRGNETEIKSDSILEGAIDFEGYGNAKQVINSRTNPSLTFRTVANNKVITITGGTAFSDIFGSIYKQFGGTSASSNVKGICVGTNKIYDKPSTGEFGANATSVFSLAYRLGNCAVTNKTLIVNVDGTDYTIVFDQNYMTANGSVYQYNTTPRFTNAEIISQINTLHPTIFQAEIGGWTELRVLDDCKADCVVFQNYNLEAGTIVSILQEYSGSFNRICPADSATLPVFGVICESTNAMEYCEVALIDKSYFQMSLLYPDGAIKGTMFKVIGGSLVPTTVDSEAIMIAVDGDTIGMISKTY